MGDPGHGSGSVFFSMVPENRSLHKPYRIAGYTAFARFFYRNMGEEKTRTNVHCHSESDAPKQKEETTLYSRLLVPKAT